MYRRRKKILSSWHYLLIQHYLGPFEVCGALASSVGRIGADVVAVAAVETIEIEYAAAIVSVLEASPEVETVQIGVADVVVGVEVVVQTEASASVFAASVLPPFPCKWTASSREAKLQPYPSHPFPRAHSMFRFHA